MANRASPNHEKNERVRITALDNSKLLREFRWLAGGDDYDGCFTANGEITFRVLKEVLRNRLVSSGFLPDDFTLDSWDC